MCGATIPARRPARAGRAATASRTRSATSASPTQRRQCAGAAARRRARHPLYRQLNRSVDARDPQRAEAPAPVGETRCSTAAARCRASRRRPACRRRARSARRPSRPGGRSRRPRRRRTSAIGDPVLLQRAREDERAVLDLVVVAQALGDAVDVDLERGADLPRKGDDGTGHRGDYVRAHAERPPHAVAIVRVLNQDVGRYHRWCTPSILEDQERVEDFYASDVSISAGFFGTLVDHTGIFARPSASPPTPRAPTGRCSRSTGRAARTGSCCGRWP